MNPISSNCYTALPAGLFSHDAPVPVAQPRLLLLNDALLDEYGLAPDWFRSAEALAILSGGVGNPANPPLAMAYAGHQFGQRVPLLGDGRAHMLGQMDTTRGLIDVQLKGSGPTTYSRGGDGRATLSSVLREYIISEAMAGLGIPTTRSLAVIATGEPVFRERPEPGGILARTAQSHIRVGSFQLAASHTDAEVLRALTDHMLAQHFPECRQADNPYLALLAAASRRQAQLIAQWMLVGFIHGVMNTDNMSIVGETIDFGPCAFMDEFNFDKVFSSIDRRGRYAWSRQPGIGLWNLTRLAETLLPLLEDDAENAVRQAEATLEKFMPLFQESFYEGMRLKLGLPDQTDATVSIADRTLEMLHAQAIDMTVFFDTLTHAAITGSDTALRSLLADVADAQDWLDAWHAARAPDAAGTMRRANPAVIARNHRVEEALRAATEHDDLGPVLRLVAALRTPFDCADEHRDLQAPPRPEERVTQTFCGT
ncbi:MAG: YdiU family protein [Gammaproteobacteria bacterium]|jgi:uncharacterized protein YdiU (UPF0061 family)|nr:YdiU family protein [Gammaproteobacteria bacterium]